MATAESVKGKIQGLIDSANAATGNTDADLSTAVGSLIAGFGQGGGGYTNEQIIALADRSVTEFVIPDGCAKIASMFFNCNSLEHVHIPNSVTSIDIYAFSNCSSLQITELPNGITRIGGSSFTGCQGVVLNSLPSELTEIGNYAFQSTGVAFSKIPGGTKRIETAAFLSCGGLSTITFMGTPEYIASNVFGNCANITTLNVPWSEGAVANAPWGATNATINYNYVEG